MEAGCWGRRAGTPQAASLEWMSVHGRNGNVTGCSESLKTHVPGLIPASARPLLWGFQRVTPRSFSLRGARWMGTTEGTQGLSIPRWGRVSVSLRGNSTKIRNDIIVLQSGQPSGAINSSTSSCWLHTIQKGSGTVVVNRKYKELQKYYAGRWKNNKFCI